MAESRLLDEKEKALFSRDRELVFNGINGTTGRSLIPNLSPEDVVRLVRGERRDLGHLADLKERHERMNEDDMDVAFGVDSRELAETGWGVVFPYGFAEEIREALAPLLEHRRDQATECHEHFYKELVLRPGESKARFLARHEVGPGPVNPEALPYYLLLVGSPEEIPYPFQYQLDVQYAVGRIYFDKLEDYAQYARSVVEAETQAPVRPRRMAFFGPANPDDKSTRISREGLVEPLAARLLNTWGAGAEKLSGEQKPWDFDPLLADVSTKAGLEQILGGDRTPALLFSASHGVGFLEGDPRQLPHQGSILCQDWPGPKQWVSRLPEDHYFSADDIGEKADLRGLIAFFFNCYGAGTPRFDEFSHRTGSRKQLAASSFLARLPQKLLAHPRGGALAFVGHVDRAWGYSFDWPQAPQQLGVFTSAFGRLFEGYPVGAAMEYFNQRYAELSSDLSQEIENLKYGGETDLLSISGMWTANNDARSYVVIGDPAVRIATR